MAGPKDDKNLWDFPLVLPQQRMKRLVKQVLGEALIRLMPATAKQIERSGVAHSLTERLIIAGLIARHRRAGTLEALAHFHRKFWESTDAVAVHAENAARFEASVRHQEDFITSVVEKVEHGPFDRVCEFGCGTGKLLAIIAARATKPAVFVGVDLSAEQIAGRLGDALVYPVIPFAITGDAAAKSAHMRFPGSVTLPPDVFAGLVRGVAQSALAAGFKLVALMGDHGGGQEEMARVAQALDAQSKRSGARVLHVGDLYTKADAQFDELMAKRGITSKELHAGISDTSAIMFLGAESWIRKDKIAAASEANGVQGSPALATAELGKLYLDIKIEAAVNQIKAFRAGK